MTMTNTAREMGVQTASAIVHELTRAVERLSNAIPLLAERIERPMLTRTLTVPSDAVDNVYVQLTTAIRERDEKSAEVAKLQSELTGARVSSGRFQQELAEVELERSGWKASAEKWQHANRDAHRWLGGRDDEMLGDVSRRVAETLRDLSLRVPELERERDEARAACKAVRVEIEAVNA
jgi:chromosome segregation ATPase